MVSYCFIEHALCFSGGGGCVYGIAVNPLLLRKKSPKKVVWSLAERCRKHEMGAVERKLGGGASRDITAAPPPPPPAPNERQEVSRDLHIDDVFYSESN